MKPFTYVPFVLIAFALLITSCASHYQNGMEAYRLKNYPKAVRELKQVPETDPNYQEASSTLSKAEFRVVVSSLQSSGSTVEATAHLKKMVAIAITANSKDMIQEAFAVALQELKKAKNADYLKEIVASLIAIVKNQADSELVGTVLKELTLKIKDVLFNSELRSVITDALKDIKSF